MTQIRLRSLFLPLATPRERRWRRVVLIGPVFILGVAGVTVFFGAMRGSPNTILACVPVLWLLVMSLLLCFSVLVSAHDQGLRHLRDTGYRVCTKCQYDLSASPHAGRCPECGTDYTADSLRTEWERIYERLQNKPGS
jgi:ssDNA-binding Zn-finger/Zn-ribbon topoisomerase 1